MNWKQKLIRFFRHYLMFFLLAAFLISCCMILFVETLTRSLGITLTEENVQAAAKVTMGNVLFLAFLGTAIDTIRHKLSVERPVNEITTAANRMAAGDFSVQLRWNDRFDSYGFGQIAAALNTMARELSGVETLRSDFVANVSHEIRTPLAVIQNYATLLSAPGLTEQSREEYTKAIIGATHRLSDLITNILKLNKLENQQIFPQFQPYDLGEQLCECMLTFEKMWEEKQLQIEADIAQEIYVRSDREMMELVWNNLISNAIKFTEPGGTVSLSLRTEGGYAVVRISDTGCGISPETGKHIFDKFYQGDISRASQGNGLGLALVKRVIDITGSQISVSSQTGVGSTFTVKIRRDQNGTT